MKTIFQWMPALAALTVAGWNVAALAQDDDFSLSDWEGGAEKHSELAIHADGSSQFTMIAVQSRMAAEQQARAIEQYRKISESQDADADENAPKPELTATNAAKPFTDEELAKALTNSINDATEVADRTVSVEVKKDAVITTTVRSFSTLEDMLKNSQSIWWAGSLAFENVRLEKDTNNLLRITFTPQAGMDRYLKSLRARWKLSGAKSELRLVLPGKVVSSGFPAMETNATWVAVDAKKDDSLDAVAKLYAAPTVITAELGGLTVDHPLEAKELWRARRQGDVENDDLPITDAGPGFATEAQSITTTALHVFPGGEEYYQQNGTTAGAVVNVKLFAPKGRTMKSVSDSRVISAVDDKGRSVAPESNDGDNSTTESIIRSEGGSSEAGSVQVELRVQLPQPDAQSIDKLSAEAVAVTVGSWKEMTLTNLEANPTNQVDLSDLLPGAKLVITKVSSKNGQFSLQARLSGPTTVKRLDFRAKIPDNDQYNSSVSDRNSVTKNGQTTRNIEVQGYGYGSPDNVSPAAVLLVLRYPQDLRRERVKFELKGLDLL